MLSLPYPTLRVRVPSEVLHSTVLKLFGGYLICWPACSRAPPPRARLCSARSGWWQGAKNSMVAPARGEGAEVKAACPCTRRSKRKGPSYRFTVSPPPVDIATAQSPPPKITKRRTIFRCVRGKGATGSQNHPARHVICRGGADDVATRAAQIRAPGRFRHVCCHQRSV